MGWMNELRMALRTALTPVEREPPKTDERARKAARKAEIEYANFIAYDGTEQPPIDEATL